jgi:hypothetical protein
MRRSTANLDALIRLALSCSGLMLAGGCGADFEPGSRVHDVRLLALRADRPFARPGERVELELLVGNPRERALQWAKSTCTLPTASTLDACLSALDGPLEPFDPDVPGALSVDVPEDALDGLSDAARPSALIGVVVVACPGQLADGETGGVPIACRDQHGRVLPIGELPVGIKRVFLRARDRNAAPRIMRVLFDGEEWPEDEPRRVAACASRGYEIDDCPQSTRHGLSVQTEPAERGRDELGAAFREQIVVQFYASSAVLRDEVRIAGEADNAFAFQPDSATGGDDPSATLWLVARDDRGGVDWATRTVQLP